MEFLKEVFGDKALTYDELAEALKNNKSIKLANLASGAYVGKEKFDALEADRNGLKEQLAAANEQIEGFKELDVDGIKAKADEWKQKAEQAERELDERIAGIQFDHALEKQLAGAKARDAGIIMGLLDREGLKLTDDGKILGLEEQLSKIKEEKGFLFESEDEGMPQIVRGGTGGGGGSANDTAAARAVMGLPPEEK